MDKLAVYRQAIEKVLSEYARYKPSHGEIEMLKICDREGVLSIEQITQAALSLPNALRVLLVEKLIESLEFDVDETVRTSWTAAAKQRRDEIRTGVVQSIPFCLLPSALCPLL